MPEEAISAVTTTVQTVVSVCRQWLPSEAGPPLLPDHQYPESLYGLCSQPRLFSRLKATILDQAGQECLFCRPGIAKLSSDIIVTGLIADKFTSTSIQSFQPYTGMLIKIISILVLFVINISRPLGFVAVSSLCRS